MIFLKGNINYSIVYLDNGKTKLLSHTLKFYEEFIGKNGFLRVHRAFLINPNHVMEYCEVKEVVKMKNGHDANISRRRKGKGSMNSFYFFQICVPKKSVEKLI